MRVYRSSGIGCLFILLISFLILGLLLKLTGFLFYSLISSPVLLLILIAFFYFRRREKAERTNKTTNIDYEFIDEEDPEV